MVPRLNVALVYNMKKTNGGGVSEAVSERSDEGNGDIAVVSRAKLQNTRVDTYAEWDSEETILAVKTALEQRHAVALIEADEEAYQKFLQVQPDIVFNIAEGLRGPSREAQIPAVLEMLGIPYTGSDPLTLGICLDKSRAKEILSHHGVLTPPFKVVTATDELDDFPISFPCIVKPLHEGSSKGVLDSSVVRSGVELRTQVDRVLRTYHEPALVEKFLAGREFTVALLGNDKDVRVLPIIEIQFHHLPKGANPIYSYEAKWEWDTIEHPMGNLYTCPAAIDRNLETAIRELCLKAYDVLRCRDWCRIDVRLDETGRPHVIELNPLPGILPNPDDHSAFPMAARAAGLDYQAMLNEVLNLAIKRHGIS
ncbi:MAG TPA: ATP-grasp domain-containing protein [Bacteroidota bacterium]